MEITGAHSLDAILIGGGKDPARSFIPQFMQQNSFAYNLQKKGNFRFSVIFMVTVDERIFLCMVVTSLVNLRIRDCFHSSCPKSVPFSFITIQDLETKNQKSQQLEWLYSTK